MTNIVTRVTKDIVSIIDKYIHGAYIRLVNTEYNNLYLPWWDDDNMQFGSMSLVDNQYIANYRTIQMNTHVYRMLSINAGSDQAVASLPLNYYYSKPQIDTHIG